MNEWLVFAGIMAVGQFSPGPDMILLTRTALARGRVAGCFTAIGIACGLACHAAVAVAGVAILLQKHSLIEQTMRYAAAAYLIWLSVQLIKSFQQAKEVSFSGENSLNVPDEALGFWQDWRRGFFCNILNPKVAVFLAGVTTPFLTDGSGWRWPFVLWLTIVLEGVLLWCLWVNLLQIRPIRSIYATAARWFDLIFGVSLAVVAVLLLLTK